VSVREDQAADHVDDLSALAALVLGGLPPDEAAAVRAHVDGCLICASAEPELTAAVRMLRDLPPEALLDGPPEDAEQLVARTLDRLRFNDC
jgi:anti-sigma factor RsiW